MLNFYSILYSDSLHIIADALHKCFIDGDIKNKICSITIDNAKINDVALRHLKYVYNMRKSLIVGRKLFYVCCCGHVTNFWFKITLARSM